MTENHQNDQKNQKLSSIGLIFLIDITLTAVSFVASYAICMAIWPELSEQKILIQLPIIIAITSLIFLFIGYRKGVVKYDRTKEVYCIFNAICLTNIFTIVLVVIHSKFANDNDNENSFLIPLSIIVVHSFLSFVALIASRFLFKTLYTTFVKKQLPLTRILLMGAMADTQKLIRAFEQSSATAEEYSIVGFVSLDENEPSRSAIGSVCVVDKNQLNDTLLRDYDVSQLMVSKSNENDKQLKDFLLKTSISPLKIKVAVIDNNQADTDGSFNIKAIRNLNITDMYWGENLDFKGSSKEEITYFKNKKILIVGAAGCVGSALVKKFVRCKFENILLLDKADDALFKLEQELAVLKIQNTRTLLADILDKNRLENVFKEFAPDIIINAAGYKIFDFTKDNLYEALRLNVLGNKLISDLAVKYGVQKYINLSRNLPIKYCTYARATERIGEMYLNCLNAKTKTEFVNIRFGNVLESKSSVMNVFKRQLESGGPIKISSKDALISFISVGELADLIVEVIPFGRGADIFEVHMGKPVQEVEFAKQMISLAQPHVADHIDIVEVENLNIAEPLCEPIFHKTKTPIVPYDLNKKLSCSKEEDFDTTHIKSKINELCVANLFIDKNITALMDQILKYENSKISPKYNALNTTVSEKKTDPLAV